MTLPRSARVVASAVVLGGVVAAGLLSSPSTPLTAVESTASDPYRFGLVVAGLYLVRPALAWPTTPLAVVVGYGYGVALGVPIALVGVVVTVIPVFVVVRRTVGRAGGHDGDVLGGFGLLERTGRAVDRYYEAAGPVRGVTASRLAPIPSDVSTAAAATSGVKLRHLVAGTAIGELPWTVAGVVVGASAATVTTTGLGEFGLPLAVACALAATLLLAGPAYRLARERATPR
ncbi:TVP38/TMEM64 family protein [Natrialbaceae archaeon AArc-T1-2]|uniref:TVP38/TMEM64 family protein n=1 Tax=Natrialbaceae archaeon AArc-T1-2 TaxID=3053904 RepID=UPI00255AAA2F|nr:VTT domain-containing protein [Natrialbaceae archaeon AArc-T1-2]WIV67903.1 VTT domain-containing protein [Natrialbaceae archaeon AArc-T1-2]